MSEAGGYRILCSEASEALRELPTNSVDALVTDPPAGIGFMGKDWDNPNGVSVQSREPRADDKTGKSKSPFARSPGAVGGRQAFIASLTPIFAECLRVMKPGAHGVVWALPRTSHWTATALEDAGFEIRDVVTHLFGCLTDDAEILTSNGWCHHADIEIGTMVMAYECASKSFQWQAVERVHRYDYDDTVYRVRGDRTDHRVSRGHNCVIERNGEFARVSIEEAAREREARVPVLESMQDLLATVPVQHKRAGDSKPILRDMPHARIKDASEKKKASADMSDMRTSIYAKRESRTIEGDVLLKQMLRNRQGCRPCGEGADEAYFSVRPSGMDKSLGCVPCSENDRRNEPGMEGRRNVSQTAGFVYSGALCSVSDAIHCDGAEGRLHNGTSAESSISTWPRAYSDGGCASCQSRPIGQSNGKPNAVRDESRSQAVRASQFAIPDVVRFEREHYQGLVWCVTVPSGAFVARANGKAFITGNSGFPKSLDVSKAIDKAAGATPAASRWSGYGTALKPAYESWILIRKTLDDRFY
ncbi:MAG: hypothetical protein NVSMB31_01490 [Vulcanimicrobiaceae bacterium]